MTSNNACILIDFDRISFKNYTQIIIFSEEKETPVSFLDDVCSTDAEGLSTFSRLVRTL